MQEHNVKPKDLKAPHPRWSRVDNIEEVKTTPRDSLPLVQNLSNGTKSDKEESEASLNTNSQVVESWQELLLLQQPLIQCCHLFFHLRNNQRNANQQRF